MRVALVSHLYPSELYPYYGKFIKDQFELLSSITGIEVDLFVPTPYSFPSTSRWDKNNSELLSNGKRVKYLSFPSKKFPRIIRSSLSKNLSEVLRNGNYDLVHLHWLYPDGMAIPELQKEGFKTVLTIHGSDWYQSFKRKDLQEIILNTLQTTDLVLYSGPKLKRDMEQLYPWLEEKSGIGFNVVNTERYKPVSETKEALRKKLNWDASKIHALTVANIRHEKGIDLLLNAIKKNLSVNIQYHLIGKLENSEFSQKILTLLDAEIAEKIELIDPVAPDELIKYYQAADFYVLPSRREGFNVSILEATACGLPIVCTDVGGNSILIELGAGILTKDSTELSDKLVEMISSYKNYSATQLHDLIDSHFGEQVISEKLVSYYKKVLD